MADRSQRPVEPNGTAGLFEAAIRGVSWSMAGLAAQACIQMASLIILARLLTPLDYGRMSIALIYVGLSNLFARMGIGYAIVQTSKPSAEDLPTALFASLNFGVLASIACVLLAQTYSAIFGDYIVARILYLLSPTFIAHSSYSVLVSYLQRSYKFRDISTIEFISVLISVIVAILLAWMEYGIWALVWLYILNEITKCFIAAIFASPIKFGMDFKAIKRYFVFGSGVTLTQLGAYISSNADDAIVGKLVGSSALGIYDRAFRIISLASNVFGIAVDKVLYVSATKVSADFGHLASMCRRSIFLTFLIAFPISVAVAISARPVVQVILGSQWNDVVGPLRILAAGLALQISLRVMASVVKATGRVYALALRQSIYCALVVLGAIVGVQFGITGVAAAVVIALAFHALSTAQLLVGSRILTWKSFAKAHLPGLALAAGCAALTWAILSLADRIGLSSLVTLLCIAAGNGGLAASLMKLFPQVFLGIDGQWWIKRLTKFRIGSATPNRWIENGTAV